MGTLLLTGGCRYPDGWHCTGAGGCSSLPQALCSVEGSWTKTPSFAALPEVANSDAQGLQPADGGGAVKKARSSKGYMRCSLATRRPCYYFLTLRLIPSGTSGNALAFRFVSHAPSACRQRAQLRNHSLSAGPFDATEEWSPQRNTDR